MGILSKMRYQLMERKNLRVYLELRLKQIQHNKSTLVDEIEEDPHQSKEDIEFARSKLKGRELELKRILKHLNKRRIQEESKETWNYLYDEGVVEYRDMEGG